MPDAIKSMVVNGTTIEYVERGTGRPILFLHPGIGIDPDAPVLHELAKGGRVIAPSHPGFGTSQLPKGMTTVDDVSYFYLDLLEAARPPATCWWSASASAAGSPPRSR